MKTAAPQGRHHADQNRSQAYFAQESFNPTVRLNTALTPGWCS